jgi:lipopolysaccharide transport system ATP-binding protein
MSSPVSPDLLVSAQAVSRKFCRDRVRSRRYALADALHDLTSTRPGDRSLRRDEFWALKDVSFDLERGESLAVMGMNGAGKSTLLKTVLGSLRLTEGRMLTRGRVTALSEHGLGFDPMLTGRANIHMSAAVLGIDRQRVAGAFDAIVAFAGVEDFIDSPLRVYSPGMRARLGFAVAMHLAPDVLLVDEVLTVGDIGFQRRCIEHTQRYLASGGSLVLVSHNPHLVQFMCRRCLVLDHGFVQFNGDVVEGVARYLEAARTVPADVVALDAALMAPSTDGTAGLAANGGIAIEDFGIQPVISGALRTGEPARIHVRYVAARDVTVRWGFCLLTAGLDTTIACDGPPGSYRLAAGAGELTGTVPRLPLASGQYALRVAIMDPATELPFALRGFADPPRYFAVEMRATVRDNYRMFTGDLVALDDVRWEPPPPAHPASAAQAMLAPVFVSASQGPAGAADRPDARPSRARSHPSDTAS